MDIRKLQKTVVKALEDIKAHDIEVFDVSHLTSLFDRVIIASADSVRQTKALATNVREKAKEAGAGIFGTEGEDSGEWVLIDLGDIVVHVMQPAARAHYNLEELWNQPKPRAARKSAARRAHKSAAARA
ncbi:MAG: ribosome silencing factor [Betaproteobacteria bacterium]|nr:ribosome silencing factor [Betaproteobacteria bacterium]